MAVDARVLQKDLFTTSARGSHRLALLLREFQYLSYEEMALALKTSRTGAGAAEPLDTSESSRPEHSLEKADQERQVQQALNRLSVEHRTVLILKDMEGQKYETMADVLQVPIGTIRSRLHRARLELRELLEQEEA